MFKEYLTDHSFAFDFDTMFSKEETFDTWVAASATIKPRLSHIAEEAVSLVLIFSQKGHKGIFSFHEGWLSGTITKQNFLYHRPADGMIEQPILLVCLKRQFPIRFFQLLVERSYELHPSDLAQELCDRPIDALAPGTQSNLEVSADQLDVLRLVVTVRFSHRLYQCRR